MRIDAETMARVDALMPRFSIPGRLATRSDVMRALILRGLESYEAAQRAELPKAVDPSQPLKAST